MHCIFVVFTDDKVLGSELGICNRLNGDPTKDAHKESQKIYIVLDRHQVLWIVMLQCVLMHSIAIQ